MFCTVIMKMDYKSTLESFAELMASRGLERRLIARLPRERGPGVPEGRSKPKPSDEEFWHAAGVYNSQEASHNRAVSTKTIAPGEAACGEKQPFPARESKVISSYTTKATMIRVTASTKKSRILTPRLAPLALCHHRDHFIG